MCGSRSLSGTAVRCSVMSEHPAAASSSCRLPSSAARRLSSRVARSVWERFTTAPQWGKLRERPERAVTAVDSVQVQVRAVVAQRERPGDGAQQLRAPGPRRPGCHQVAESPQVQGGGLLLLEERKVGDPVRAGEVAAGLLPAGGGTHDVGEQRRRRERRQPGAGLARHAKPLGGVLDLLDEDLEIGDLLVRALSGGRPGGLGPAETRPGKGCHPWLGDDGGDGSWPPSADPSGLERDQRTVPEPDIGPARGGFGDGGGVGCVDHVSALGRVGDPERDPQVGVGADIGRHHA